LTGRGLGRVAARLPVGYKILLPFLALTLVSGLTFATVAALELATGATAQADTLLVRQGDATAERIASFGDSQQVALRLLTGAPGLADAVEVGLAGAFVEVDGCAQLRGEAHEPRRRRRAGPRVRRRGW